MQQVSLRPAASPARGALARKSEIGQTSRAPQSRRCRHRRRSSSKLKRRKGVLREGGAAPGAPASCAQSRLGHQRHPEAT